MWFVRTLSHMSLKLFATNPPDVLYTGPTTSALVLGGVVEMSLVQAMAVKEIPSSVPVSDGFNAA